MRLAHYILKQGIHSSFSFCSIWGECTHELVTATNVASCRSVRRKALHSEPTRKMHLVQKKQTEAQMSKQAFMKALKLSLEYFLGYFCVLINEKGTIGMQGTKKALALRSSL